MKKIIKVTRHTTIVTAIVLLILSSHSLAATTFSSGSTGADGALNILTSVVFDDVSYPALDADNDGIYNFTTINIAAGATVTFSPTFFTGRPIYWLASDDVTIEGTIDVSGSPGYDIGAGGLVVSSVPGPGGYQGGLGSTAINYSTRGLGPGGGDGTDGWTFASGHGAGFLTRGGSGYDGSSSLNPGKAYGNRYMLPLLGGSGGGGGGKWSTVQSSQGGGGGAGAGAILIASSTNISMNGIILAKGGDGGDNLLVTDERYYGGGGGSGGSIRLMGNTITGTGTMSAKGGAGGSTKAGKGSPGYIKMEAYTFNYSGGSETHVYTARPSYVFIPSELVPIKITKVGGQAVPANARAMFDPADIVINNSGNTIIEIEARNIPLATVVELSLVSETGEVVNVDSTPLAGTLATSTATASITVPFGFSRFYVQATWN